MNKKIIVKALSGCVTGADDLSLLDGIDSPENFSEYFRETSYKKDVTGGHMEFKYEQDKLWVLITYSSTRELSEDELKDLGEYTQGQLSDGIGECFEQFPCKKIFSEEIFISPWYSGQKIEVTQI